MNEILLTTWIYEYEGLVGYLEGLVLTLVDILADYERACFLYILKKQNISFRNTRTYQIKRIQDTMSERYILPPRIF